MIILPTVIATRTTIAANIQVVTSPVCGNFSSGGKVLSFGSSGLTGVSGSSGSSYLTTIVGDTSDDGLTSPSGVSPVISTCVFVGNTTSIID